MLRRDQWGDPLLAGFFAAVAVLESFDTAIDDGTRVGRPWVNAAYGVLLCLPVVIRGRRPVAAYLAMVVLLAVPASLLPHEVFSLGGLPPVLLVTWSLARHRDGWFVRLCWLPPAVLPALTWETPGFLGLGELVFSAVFAIGAVVVGRTMRRFALQGAELYRVLAALAVEQEARREGAVERERARIAAEMHDVVAHAVSAMVVQVGAARMEGGPAPELAKLRRAEATGHQALEELRTTLGLLRVEQDVVVHLRPLPGLEAVDELAEGLRSAGFDVDLRVDPDRLPESVALTTFRILQEAFTNAVKHGGRGLVVASVEADDQRVVLRIESPLGGGLVALPSSGHGLAGIRERVSLFGGTLEAGVRDDLFVVEATLLLAGEPVPA